MVLYGENESPFISNQAFAINLGGWFAALRKKFTIFWYFMIILLFSYYCYTNLSLSITHCLFPEGIDLSLTFSMKFSVSFVTVFEVLYG